MSIRNTLRRPAIGVVPAYYVANRKEFPFPKAVVDLDFVNSQYKIGETIHSTLSAAGITSSRATTAWYENSSGVLVQAAINEPVQEYANGLCQGLRIEEARTNFCTSSGDQTGWTKQACSASDTFTAPDGSTGTVFLANNTTTTHRLVKASLTGTPLGNSTVNYGCYLYIPPGSDTARAWLRCRTSSANGQAVSIAVTGSGSSTRMTFIGSGPFGTSPPPAVTTGNVLIENKGNGVVKISIISQVSSTTDSVSQIDIGFSCNITEPIAGTANTKLGVWGLFIESGFVPQSYIPTTTAAVAKAADIITMSGANFSSWYSAPFTMFCKYNLKVLNGGKNRTAVSIGDGSFSNRIEHRAQTQNATNQTALTIYSNGVDQASIVSTLTPTRGGIGTSISTGNISFSTNRSPVQNVYSGTLPSVNQMQFGALASNTFLCGYLERVIIIQEKLNNPLTAGGSI